MKKIKISTSLKSIKTLLVILTSAQLSIGSIAAQKRPNDLTDKDPVSRDSCIILLRDKPTDWPDATQEITEETQDLQAQFEANQIRMTAINERYQIINQEIELLESGQANSLDEANLVLDEVVETLYQEYAIAEPEFVSLSADEQLAIIAQDPVVIEWQDYIDELHNIIDTYVTEQVDLEAEYQQLNYDNETLAEMIEDSKLSRTQRNQCLLYPYSPEVSNFDPDFFQFNQTSLAAYLVSVSDYLKQLVPTAYSKVTFQQIYDLFNRDIGLSALQSLLEEKEVLELTDETFHAYQYAKDLSLFEIEGIASQALVDYYQHDNPEIFRSAYLNLLNLKESQLQYFYTINEEALNALKDHVAAFLNQNGMTSEAAIQQIKTLHQRFQMKLVLFDPDNNTWQANPNVSSGYLNDFSDKRLMQTKDEDVDLPTEEQIKGRRLQPKGLLKTPDFVDDSEVDKSKPIPSKDNINYLKDRLATRKEPKKANQLAKPKAELDKNKKETTSENKKDKKPNWTLPSTGEQRFYLLISAGILVIGISLLAWNYWRKNKARKEETKAGLEGDFDEF